MHLTPPDIEQAAARFWSDPATRRAREALANPDAATLALIERLQNSDELTRRLMREAPGAPSSPDAATRALIESAGRTVRAIAPAVAAFARQHPALRAIAPAVAAFAGRTHARFNR